MATPDWINDLTRTPALTAHEFARVCCGWNPFVPDEEDAPALFWSVFRRIRRAVWVRDPALDIAESAWPNGEISDFPCHALLFRPKDVAPWAARMFPETFPASAAGAFDVVVPTSAPRLFVDQYAVSVGELASACAGVEGGDAFADACDFIGRAIAAGDLVVVNDLRWPPSPAEQSYHDAPLVRPSEVWRWAAEYFPKTFRYTENDFASQVSRSPSSRQRTNTEVKLQVFLESVNRLPDLPCEIILKHVWQAAGYADDTDLGNWKRESSKASQSAIDAYNRIIGMMPEKFVELLRTQGRLSA